jgi:hypothetical protein
MRFINGNRCFVNKRVLLNIMFSPSIDQDRRRYPRYRVQKIVSYTHGQKELLTLTLDLAMGGMKIKTHRKLPKNERLKFRLVLGNNSIPLEGRIVYSRILPEKQSISGVQFLRHSAQESVLLTRYLCNLE